MHGEIAPWLENIAKEHENGNITSQKTTAARSVQQLEGVG